MQNDPHVVFYEFWILSYRTEFCHVFQAGNDLTVLDSAQLLPYTASNLLERLFSVTSDRRECGIDIQHFLFKQLFKYYLQTIPEDNMEQIWWLCRVFPDNDAEYVLAC